MKKLFIILAIILISSCATTQKSSKEYNDYICAKEKAHSFELMYNMAKKDGASEERLSELGDSWNVAKKESFVKFDEYLQSIEGK